MPETLGDYLAHGWEKGLLVGPWAALAAGVCLALGYAIARRGDERALGAAAGAAIALSFAAAAVAVAGGEPTWWPSGHGKDWLLPFALAAVYFGVHESG